MLFNSYVFLFVFLPVTLAGFYGLASAFGPKPAKVWLVLASLLYYGWWNPMYLILILGSMVFNYSLGTYLGRKDWPDRHKRVLLIAGLAANLLMLCYYKYANFFVTNLNSLCGTSWTFEKLILPLGISFFTFQQMAYLVDARRGEVCEYDFFDFILFVTFFPQLIAGPIVHHAEMMPQFAQRETYRFHWDNLAIGLAIFAIGLFKKVNIADSLSGHVASVYGAAAEGHALYTADAWAGVLAYTFQIYFDFSGYSDMALGLGRMFNIILPLNFNAPFKSVNYPEFWRRWHLTLSRCLRDYLYIPLGGSRCGPIRRHFNLMVTMVLGGLWHGAGWTYVIWGFLHGLYLVMHHFWEAFKIRAFAHRPPPEWLLTWAGRAFTFFLLVFSLAFFRAEDLHATGQLLSAMFVAGAGPVAGTPALLKAKLWIWLIGLLAFVWLAPSVVEMFHNHQPASATMKGVLPKQGSRLQWKMSPAWAGYAALLLAAAILSLSKASEFLYYNF